MPPLTLVTLRYAVDYGSYMKRPDVAQHLEYPIHVQESAAPTLESVERAIQYSIVNPHGRSRGTSKIHLKTLDIALATPTAGIRRLLLACRSSPLILPSSGFVH
ncbi:hypothetical protein QLX08_001340 [Tetragonisca angustula]|uniref:Uncharacterized protein n=1 Tax=Tetragonisca angustula TaxID=166442 RepID=A0AAW1AHW6_9HYME